MSGLFSNPPAAVWLPVMLRRFPRRNRSATGYVSPCLPAFQRLLLFFPLAGWAGGGSDVSFNYWTSEVPRYDPGNGYVLTGSVGRVTAAEFRLWASGLSVRCVRAREGQAIPCFFPLAGSAGGPSDVTGTYWSSTGDRSGVFYYCAFAASSAVVTPIANVAVGYSVRCVRAREGQAIPLFWIVWFWVL